MAPNSISSNSNLQQLQMRVLEKLIHFKNKTFWKRLEQMVNKEDFLTSIENGERAIEESKVYSLEDIIREIENC